MKKLGIVLGLVLTIATLAYASKPNVYQKTTDTFTTASSVITFPYTVKDLVVKNDGSQPAWIGINVSSLTGWNVAVESTTATWLAAGGEIDLYDTACDYLAISKVSIPTSRVTVIATY
jgi:hypothetical protein